MLKRNLIRKSHRSFEKFGDVSIGWVIISHHLITGKKIRRKAYGKWYKFQSNQGTVFRVIRFSPNISSNQIVIDWQAWLELSGYSEKVPESIELSISPAKLLHLPLLSIKHPDPVVRLSCILGIISIILGVLSFFLAIVAFI
jgi:hypothetical protein